MDVLISRDLDELMTLSHITAVKEWLDSNKTFHVIQDLPAHNTTVLAGLWGIKLNQNSVREAWKPGGTKPSKNCG